MPGSSIGTLEIAGPARRASGGVLAVARRKSAAPAAPSRSLAELTDTSRGTLEIAN